MFTNNMSDPRRPNKIQRYKPPSTENNPTLEDPTPDYMNLLGMIFSMCGLMLKVINFSRCDVIPSESSAHVSSMVIGPSSLNLLFQTFSMQSPILN
ncbi:PAT complex subunit Asterix isoform X2 [Protopterus annectens]|uniref:PAT complex subunit Asterix isoform X2 n=1 Tax=Protopterus annectens TaxID=7888 RepID=UPI001CFA5D0E|nr:PAT complex subunit Asterix isoform X2 [Protopterus annectens]